MERSALLRLENLNKRRLVERSQSAEMEMEGDRKLREPPRVALLQQHSEGWWLSIGQLLQVLYRGSGLRVLACHMWGLNRMFTHTATSRGR